VFYRNKGAYVVGMVHTDGPDVPFLLALTNPCGKVVVDAALLSEALESPVSGRRRMIAGPTDW